MKTNGLWVTDGVFFIPLDAHPTDRFEGDPPSPQVTDVFIGGPENRLANVAVRTVLAEDEFNPSSLLARFNPLVLYGPTGTGKSLLALGLAHKKQTRQPEENLVVLTGADFARGYANAVQTDSLAHFRAKRQQAGLVVIEDLDELEKKPAAQHELMYQLDHWTGRHVLVVLTLRQSPGETNWMPTGLCSRLTAGLTIPLAAPEAAARQAILEHAAAERGVVLATSLAEQLAQLEATAPELQGVLTRLEHASLPHCFGDVRSGEMDFGRASPVEIQPEQVEEFLQRQLTLRKPTLRAITSVVSRRFRLKTTELKGAARRQTVVRARGLAMYLSRELTDKSLKQVGQHYGGRDHTTVMHACQKTAQLIQNDPETQEIYTHLRRQLCPSVAIG